MTFDCGTSPDTFLILPTIALEQVECDHCNQKHFGIGLGWFIFWAHIDFEPVDELG